jgi:hypothetical protein
MPTNPNASYEVGPSRTHRSIYWSAGKLRLPANPFNLRQLLDFIERHEPVFVDVEDAIGIIRAHVCAVDIDQRRSVAVSQFVLTPGADKARFLLWQGHVLNVGRLCDIRWYPYQYAAHFLVDTPL